MINKIKDFLKNKLSKKASKDLSDQDELLDDDGFSEDQTNPTLRVSEVEAEVEPPATQLGPEDRTNDINPELLSPSSEEKVPLKEKFTATFAGLKDKIARPKLKSFSIPSLPSISAKGDGSPLLSPSLSKSIEKVLSRTSREPIHQFFIVALVGAITYSLGKVTALSLKGAPVLNTSRDFAVTISLEDGFNPATLSQVKSINIFRTNSGKGPKKNNIADKKCEEAEQNSSLPIKLVNTVVLQDTVKSLASVQVRGDRDLQEVRIGDQISNMAQIFKISRLEMLVKNLETGACESIVSDKALNDRRSPISVLSPSASRDFKRNKALPGIENVGNKFTIQKTLLDEKLKDIASILTQARAVKIQNPDGSLSFKMTELDPNGIFGYLGIQDQDIITSINGKPIYDLNEVMGLFGRIKNLEQLSLGIKREGTDSVQEYSIKK